MNEEMTDLGSRSKSFYREWSRWWRAAAQLAWGALLPGAWAEPVETYARVEQFQWEEFFEGERLLKEDGLRAGFGVRGLPLEYPTWQVAARAEATLGRVDYDGQTFAGDPVESNTDYYGMRGEVDLLLRSPNPVGFSFQPRFGIGARYWLRRIAEGDTDAGGYDEGWFMLYARLGGIVQWAIDPQTRIFLSVARRPALYNETYYSIELEDEETFSLKPGRDATWEIEAGLTVQRIRISVFYETLSFEQSNSKIVPPLELFQPESEGRIVGAQIGLLW